MIHTASSDFLRALNCEQKQLAMKAWPYVLGYIVFGSAPNILLDIYYYEEAGAYLWAGVLVWVMGYILLLAIMKQGGLFAHGKTTGIGTYFVLEIAIDIPVGLALVVFIFPGLYLLMRWLPVYARALTSPNSIGNSLRWSWNATQRFQKPLLISMVGPVLCFGVAVGCLYLYDGSSWTVYILSSVVSNLAMSIAYAWLTILGAASFGMLASIEEDDKQLTLISDRA